nr:EOG090X0IKQ [Sida crystallina]
MASIVLKSLSIFLGLFFIFVGIMKLTPYLSKELHKDLRTEYVKYAKVFPLARIFNTKIPSKWFRRAVGGLEIICGIALTFIPHKRTKQIANLILVILMLGAIYAHWAVDDKLERSAPALVFFFMLTCRLVVEWQVSRRGTVKPVAPSATNEATAATDSSKKSGKND